MIQFLGVTIPAPIIRLTHHLAMNPCFHGLLE